MIDNTKIFKRNLTSELLTKSWLSLDISPQSRCLDLGCGDGNILLSVVDEISLNKVYGSDISSIATTKAKEDADKRNIACDFRNGSGLDPWIDEKFDFISCDVAAISEDIANISDWYKGISCKTGSSGIELVAPIIEDIDDFLMKNGIFLIPIISLANHKLLLSKLDEKFTKVEVVNKKDWPMPMEIINHMNDKQMPMICDNWTILQKFGLYIASTSVAICSL